MVSYIVCVFYRRHFLPARNGRVRGHRSRRRHLLFAHEHRLLGVVPGAAILHEGEGHLPAGTPERILLDVLVLRGKGGEPGPFLTNTDCSVRCIDSLFILFIPLVLSTIREVRRAVSFPELRARSNNPSVGDGHLRAGAPERVLFDVFVLRGKVGEPGAFLVNINCSVRYID